MKHNIALVCDFFHPRLGGVEMHIWSLAQCLLSRGHHVIILTHAYYGSNNIIDDDTKKNKEISRKGIRYMSCGLKVYYLPLVPFFDQVVFPTFYSWLPLFRDIVIREQITIVHGQSATSCMTNEAILFAQAMGLHTCYTDHSLFGFGDIASLNINKVIRFTLSDIDAIICVSNSCLQNLVKRASIRNPDKICHVIPNAIDPSQFIPPTKLEREVNFQLSGGRIIVIVISRLTYRKGIDLLVDIIPDICHKFPKIDFIIGGDGPKKRSLEKMLVEESLQSRVELLGSVSPCQVPKILKRGHIFLNCSLTESFCIAIVEAACCGLFIVSTNVGGIPEVLPSSPPDSQTTSTSTSNSSFWGSFPFKDKDKEKVREKQEKAKGKEEKKENSNKKKHEHFTLFVEPDKLSLLEALSSSIESALSLDPHVIHQIVKDMYCWKEVAHQTERIYDKICMFDDEYENTRDKSSQHCSSANHLAGGSDSGSGCNNGGGNIVHADDVRSHDCQPNTGLVRCRHPDLWKRLKAYRTCGPLAGFLACIVATFIASLLLLLELVRPEKHIPLAIQWKKNSPSSSEVTSLAENNRK